jgi:hypothetical protein
MTARDPTLPLCNTQQEYSPPGEGEAVVAEPWPYDRDVFSEAGLMGLIGLMGVMAED